MKSKTNCESCINYIYDEEYECYECQANLDEDEMVKFMMCCNDNCSYYKFNDEYKTVRKQM